MNISPSTRENMPELASKLGKIVSKIALKLWLQADTAADDIIDASFELFHEKSDDVFEAKKLSANWERITYKICEVISETPEFRSMSSNDKVASSLEIANILIETKLDATFFANLDYDERRLQILLENQLSFRLRKDSELLQLGRSIIRVVVPYIFNMCTLLPDFHIKANQRMLSKQDEILVVVDHILNVASRNEIAIAKEANVEKCPSNHTKHILRYRNIIRNRFAKINIVGLDLPEFCTQSNIDMSYVSLRIILRGPNGGPRSYSAENAARSFSRLLVRGGPGSGKTTALQWLTILICRNPRLFGEDELEGYVPFFVPLRRYVTSKLPSIEEMPSIVVNNRSLFQDLAWVKECFESGKALLLVDGVDELPSPRREDVREWLVDLLFSYPTVRCIVTSRLSAVEAGWLSESNFASGEIEPLRRSDATQLIVKWHDAKEEERQARDGIEANIHELADYRNSLINALNTERYLQALTSSPLMCGMICALNFFGKGKLPSNRMEIYFRATELLIERRDIARAVSEPSLQKFPLDVKIWIIADLAYWMLRNRRQEMPMNDLISRIEHIFNYIDGRGVSAEAFATELVERGGVLHKVRSDSCAFVHLSLQEYLAAKSIASHNDYQFLIEKCDDSQWAEVCVFACGTENATFTNKLLRNLLIEYQKEQRVNLAILLLNSLDNSVWVEKETRGEIQGLARAILPPKNFNEAKTLADIGDIVVPLLAKYIKENADIRGNCIQVLLLIGSNSSLELLRDFISNNNDISQETILRYWESFDSEDFGREIFSKIERIDDLKITSERNLKSLRFANNIGKLTIGYCNFLTYIDSSSCLNGVECLIVSDCRRLISVHPFGENCRLRSIEFSDCPMLEKLTFFETAPQLTHISIRNCGRVLKFTDVSFASKLAEVTIEEVDYVDISPFVECKNLASITLIDCEGVFVPKELSKIVKTIRRPASHNID